MTTLAIREVLAMSRLMLGGGYLHVGMFTYPERYKELAQSGPAVLILKNTLN